MKTLLFLILFFSINVQAKTQSLIVEDVVMLGELMVEVPQNHWTNSTEWYNPENRSIPWKRKRNQEKITLQNLRLKL